MLIEFSEQRGAVELGRGTGTEAELVLHDGALQ